MHSNYFVRIDTSERASRRMTTPVSKERVNWCVLKRNTEDWNLYGCELHTP